MGGSATFIFSQLQEKTTFIRVSIEDGHINTTLTDRGEVIYQIREPNPYTNLNQSGFACEIYYLNQSAKLPSPSASDFRPSVWLGLPVQERLSRLSDRRE